MKDSIPWLSHFLFALGLFLFLSFVFGRSGRTRMRGPDFLIIGNHGLRISLSLCLERLWRVPFRYARHYSFYCRPKKVSLLCVSLPPCCHSCNPPFSFNPSGYQWWNWRIFVFTYSVDAAVLTLDGDSEPGGRGTS